MITILSVSIPLLFLFLYTVFFSFDIAAALQAWRPHRFGKTFSVTPIWELTGVFLAFALVAMIAFFPGALLAWGALLAIPLLVFLSIQAIRIGAVMVVFYQQSSSRWVRSVLMVTSVLTPGVFLGGIVPVFLLGHTAYSFQGLLLGGVIALIAIIMSTVTAVCFANYFEKKNPAAKYYFWTWIVFITIVWIVIIVWSLPSMAIIATVLTSVATAKMLLWICVAGVIIVLPGILLLYSFFL